MLRGEPEPEGLARMTADEDMKAEQQNLEQAMVGLAVGGGGSGGGAATPPEGVPAPREAEHVPLNWQRGQGGHQRGYGGGRSRVHGRSI